MLAVVVTLVASLPELAPLHVLAAVIVLALLLPSLLPAASLGLLAATQQVRRRRRRGQYERDRATWESNQARHEVRHQASWLPVRVEPHVQRVDVVGGTSDGWASLLVTAGSWWLMRGEVVLVLDFTRNGVAESLATMAGHRGFEVRHDGLTTDLDGVLRGLAPDEAVELLVRAVHSSRPGTSTAESLARDTELLELAVTPLADRLTLRRVLDALRVLRRAQDVPASLSLAEVSALAAAVDSAAEADPRREELQMLTMLFGLVAGEPEPSATEPAEPRPPWWCTGGWRLGIIATTGAHRRRAAFSERLVLERLITQLRAGGRPSPGVLVVAGADGLGGDLLEELSGETRRAGLRLVLMSEHLRGDVVQLLGGSDSASVIMRLGNAQEASAAADFIGRQHKFVVSELTRQVGRGFTEGTESSLGDQRSESRTDSAGRMVTTSLGPVSKSVGLERSNARTENLSRTWQSTVSHSTSGTVTAGTTLARTYELTVETTEIQDLPPTAFFLVQPGASRREVAAADCNPGIALIEAAAGPAADLAQPEPGRSASGAAT